IPAATGISQIVLQAVADGLGQADAGIGTQTSFDATLFGGLNQIAFGLSNPNCNPLDPKNSHNPCGEKEGLASLQAGLTGIQNGLGQIVGGLSTPKCDLTKPQDKSNPCGVKEGLTALAAGLSSAIDGADQLFAGSVQASTGAGQLAKGVGDESAGM